MLLNLGFSIVRANFHEQIVCEIDIRTPTIHQILCQLLDQVFWTRNYSAQFYWDKEIYAMCSALSTEKGYQLTCRVSLRPTHLPERQFPR